MVSIPTLLLDLADRHFEAENHVAQEAGVYVGAALAAASFRELAVPAYVSWDVTSLLPSSPTVRDHPKNFAVRFDDWNTAFVDPRSDVPAGKSYVRANLGGGWALVAGAVDAQFAELAGDGVTGIILSNPGALGADFIAQLIGHIEGAGLEILCEVDGLSDEQLCLLNGRAAAFVLSDGASEADIIAFRDRMHAEALLYLPVSFGQLRPEKVALIDGIIGRGVFREPLDPLARVLHQMAGYRADFRILSEPSAPVFCVVRANSADRRQAQALLCMANRTDQPIVVIPRAILQSSGLSLRINQTDDPDSLLLGPGEIRTFSTCRTGAVAALAVTGPSALDAASNPRLVLEGITPSVDGGELPAKRVAGEDVGVEALLYGDGHEQLAAELQWRACDADEWQTARMAQLPNDRWHGSLTLDRLGRHEFAVEGWIDQFGGFRRDFGKKRDAGVETPVDYAEGRLLVEEALTRADPAIADALARWLADYDAAVDDSDRVARLLGVDIAVLMDAADDRPHRIRSGPQLIDAERLAARYSSWYELFPRSITNDRARHGTFADVLERLPAIRSMGFDTLYFPPIHPIGTTNRKGPNNSLTPGPKDVGSPYAIGSAEGGHDALHPALGSFADFRRLVDAAAEHGLEIAIDFAIQCSPDHPWLKEHPDWFAWRPDGSMKYAENPPKKYQDIVNVDFYAPDAVPGLWLALRDIVLFWVDHGVKTFRVDNPHTKPLPFWQWMIGDVRARHPDAIFLAEAFTRPNMMYRLAKIGFSQSYTYFTWRNEKVEIADYIAELTTTAPKDFYRPHFFVNTPDINPPYLQTSGRPGFRIRAVLAATLSGLFGVYSGFELCESAPVPAKEEYLDSEKYEIRPRDYQAPGNIIADITLLNRLRRRHPALQTHLNTRFFAAENEAILYYGKPSGAGGEMILVMVNLDPHAAQEAQFEVPLWELGLPDHGTVEVEDLAKGHRFAWHGKQQWIRLAPDEPYRLWRIWSSS